MNTIDFPMVPIFIHLASQDDNISLAELEITGLLSFIVVYCFGTWQLRYTPDWGATCLHSMSALKIQQRSATISNSNGAIALCPWVVGAIIAIACIISRPPWSMLDTIK